MPPVADKVLSVDGGLASSLDELGSLANAPVEFNAESLVSASIAGEVELKTHGPIIINPDDCCRQKSAEEYDKSYALRADVNDNRALDAESEKPSTVAANRNEGNLSEERSSQAKHDEPLFNGNDLVQSAVDGQRFHEELVERGEAPVRINLDCCAPQAPFASTEHREAPSAPLDVKIVYDNTSITTSEGPQTIDTSSSASNDLAWRMPPTEQRANEATNYSRQLDSGWAMQVDRTTPQSEIHMEPPPTTQSVSNYMANSEAPRGVVELKAPSTAWVDPNAKARSQAEAPRPVPPPNIARQRELAAAAAEQNPDSKRIVERRGPTEKEIHSYLEKLSAKLWTETDGKKVIAAKMTESLTSMVPVTRTSVQYRREPTVVRASVGPNSTRVVPPRLQMLRMSQHPPTQRMVRHSRQIALNRLERLYKIRAERMGAIVERLRALRKMERSVGNLAEMRKLKLSRRALLNDLRDLRNRIKHLRVALGKDRKQALNGNSKLPVNPAPRPFQIRDVIRSPIVAKQALKVLALHLKLKFHEKVSKPTVVVLKKITDKLAPQRVSRQKLDHNTPTLDKIRMRLARRLQSLIQTLESVRLSTYSQSEALESVEGFGILKRKSEVRALTSRKRSIKKVKRRLNSNSEEDSLLKLGEKRSKKLPLELSNSKAPVLGINSGKGAKIAAKRRKKNVQSGPKKTLDLFQAEEDESDDSNDKVLPP